MAEAAGTGKVVVVTGASRGMGLEAAKEIAKRGHTVVATMRNPADFAALREADGTFDFERMDVDDPDNVKAALGSVEARHGRIDVLVNNAGYGLWGAVEDLSEDELQAQFNTNTLGTWRTCLAVLPGMRERGAGRILNLITAVRSPMPWMGAYFASKAAVWQFSAAMALEVASAGIQVAVVQPGGYKTDWQTDSLWIAARAEAGDWPHGEQTRASLDAFRAFSETWEGPDDFGQRLAPLVDADAIPFWNIVASDDQRELLEQAPLFSFEEMAERFREVIPGYVPEAKPS